MQTFDIIQRLCKEKGTSIAGLERALKFGNGSLKKSKSIKDDRLKEIAAYFGVSVDYLTGIDIVHNQSTDDITMFRLRQNPTLMNYVKKLCSLPEELQKEIFKQIDFQEYSIEKEAKEKEANSNA